MRLSLAFSALAGGLVFGWAASAAAGSPPPPAAPIFYCPQPPSAAPSAHHAHARGAHCPRREAAREDGHHHHWREHDRRYADNDDVSESQAFIYRYERALHGLDAEAADEAWAHPHGFWPHENHDDGHEAMGPPMHDGHMDQHDMMDEHMGSHMDEQMGPPPGQADADRDGHARAPDDQAGPPVREEHEEHWDGDRGVHGHDYVYEEHRGGPGDESGYRYERHESRGDTGWVWRDDDGHHHAWRWDDGDQDRGGDREGPPPCPPDSAAPCTEAHGFRAGDGQWRDGSYGSVYQVAGRDAYGYLVWPGKTPQR